MNEQAKNQMKEINDDTMVSIAPSCNIKGLAARKEAADWLMKNFYPHISSVEELDTGYELVFKKPSSEFLVRLFDIVRQETECCPSFTLGVIIEPQKEHVRYQYYGSTAIKQEMKEAFEAIGLFNINKK